MSDLLIQTRTTPPRINQNIVERENLNNLFNQNKNCSLFLVCAPAGYGKTTCILNYLQQSKHPFAWLSIPPDGINNFNTYLSYIIHSLKKLESNFGAKTSEYINLINKRAYGELDTTEIVKSSVTVFINEFCEFFQKDVYLVLDDLHSVSSESVTEWLAPFLNSLIASIPINLHLIISSREVPDLNISKLVAARNILVLGERELAFGPVEIKSLLKNIYDIEFSEEEISLLSKELRGWITGIHLLLRSSEKNFNEIKKVAANRRFLTESLFQFFAEEIFGKLSEELKDFLVSTSILDYVEKDLVNKLLESTSGEDLINETISKNLFIQQLGAESGAGKPRNANKIYSYHSLFRQFLNNKLLVVKSEDQMKELYKRAASFLVSNDDRLTAFKYYIKASCIIEASEQLKIYSAILISENKYDILWELIHLLPENIINSDPHFLYCMATLQNLYKGNFRLALKYINSAISALGTGGNPQKLFSYTFLKSILLGYLGNMKEAENTLREISHLCDTPQKRADYLYNISRVLYPTLQYDEAIKNLGEAVQIAGDNEFEQLKIRCITLLGNIYLGKGDLILALSYYDKLEFDKMDFVLRFITFCNLTETYSYMGDFEKAKVYYEKAEDLLLMYPGQALQLFLMLSKAYLEFESCNFTESPALLNKIKSLAEKSQFRYYVYHADKFTGCSYFYLKEYAKADEYFKLAQESVYEDTMKYDIMLHKTVLNFRVIPPEKISKTETEANLIKCLEYFESKGLTYYSAQAAFHTGCFYLKISSVSSAYEYFKKSLEMCRNNKFDSFLLREIFNNPEAADFLISKNIQKQYILNIRDWGSDILSGKDVEAGIKKEMLYDLSLRSFGVMKIALRGEDIEKGKTLRAAGKLILAYMLMNPGTKFTKDKIADIFFSNIPVETLDDSFHQAISSIRKATKLKYMDLLLYENKVLTLNLCGIYYSDVIEFNKLYNLFFSSAEADIKSEAAKKLINIYESDFMDGYYEPWAEELREEYKNKYIRLVESFIAIIFEKKDYENTVSFSNLLIKQDPLNETAYRYLISSYNKSGNINLAKLTYNNMINIFKKETGEEPPRKFLSQFDFLK